MDADARQLITRDHLIMSSATLRMDDFFDSSVVPERFNQACRRMRPGNVSYYDLWKLNEPLLQSMKEITDRLSRLEQASSGSTRV